MVLSCPLVGCFGWGILMGRGLCGNGRRAGLGCFLLDYEAMKHYSLPFAGFDFDRCFFATSFVAGCYEDRWLLVELAVRG